jgi:cytoplasmic FMR1 interacting protein
LPSSSSPATPEAKEDLARKIHEVLKPEIAKMWDFMQFRDHAVKMVSAAVTAVLADTKASEMYPSTAFLATLSQIFDLFIVLDTMKSIKGSMNNCLSIYKRNMALIPEGSPQDDPTKNHLLNVFLGMQDQFSSELRPLFQAAPSFDELVVDTINFCCDSLSSMKYLLAETKHAYLKAIAFGLYLLDGEGDEKDITKRKRIKLDKLAKILRATPVVPLFGDSPISLCQIFAKAPHIGQGKWNIGEYDAITLAKSYCLVNTAVSTRTEYLDFLALFRHSMNSVHCFLLIF